MVTTNRQSTFPHLAFRQLSVLQRLVFITALVLVSAAFWFPKGAILHGAGGSLIGLMALWLMKIGRSTRSVSYLLIVSSLLCVSGGFIYTYDARLSTTISVTGVTVAALALGLFVIGRKHTQEASS